MEVVPRGAIGELYLASPGIARGYQGRAELTAEKFVPHPYSREPGARLYRTGDRVRLLRDGQLEFLGRFDDQIKIRGLRIELGEIQAVLVAAPGVREAAVVVRDDDGWRRLVAYLVLEDGAALDVAALRDELGRHLPQYMVPAQLVALPALPLTISGKLDRKSLPAPDRTRVQPETEVAPRTADEIVLARMWCDVLGLERASIHDNFFEVGGDSIRAIQLVTRARQAGLALSPRHVIEYPTIARLAGVVRAGQAAWSPLVPLRTGGARPAVFCVHPGGGNVLCYAELVKALDPDRPVYGLQAAGLEAGQQVADSIEAMARSYVEAIRQVEPDGPYFLVGWSLGGTVAFEMARQLVAAGHEVSDVVLLDAYVPVAQAGQAGDMYDRIAALARAESIDIPADEIRALGLEAAVTRWVELPAHRETHHARLGVTQLQRFLEFSLAIEDVNDRYVPGPYAGRVTLLRADGEDRLHPGSTAHGWEAWTDADNLRVVPVREPALSAVAAAILATLRKQGA
jgi:thioesterase domain-containing protein/aryl carrier-like protein